MIGVAGSCSVICHDCGESQCEKIVAKHEEFKVSIIFYIYNKISYPVLESNQHPILGTDFKSAASTVSANWVFKLGDQWDLNP